MKYRKEIVNYQFQKTKKDYCLQKWWKENFWFRGGIETALT